MERPGGLPDQKSGDCFFWTFGKQWSLTDENRLVARLADVEPRDRSN